MNEGLTTTLALAKIEQILMKRKRYSQMICCWILLLLEVLDQIPKHLTKCYVVLMLNTGKKH